MVVPEEGAPRAGRTRGELIRHRHSAVQGRGMSTHYESRLCEWE
jgi:hypothetical protein